jgi:hypothetical protein
MAVASSGEIPSSPLTTRSTLSDGSPTAICSAESPIASTLMKPPIQAIALPTSSAASPTGTLPGSRTPATKPTTMIASTGSAIHSASHICAAGRMAMKVMEMPASVPRRAARGV